jgi:hypothetical protein
MTRLPDDTQRHAILGATGSGKTQAAQWHLSHRRFDLIPWIIYNFKGDESIDAIPYIREVSLDRLPTEPGVYVTHPMPGEDDDAVAAQMKGAWVTGDVGIYVDEGYMIGKRNQSFRMLLTQGRSKGVPMIVLSQRPVWMDRFVFSESEFIQVFRLQHDDDRKTAGKFVPADFDEPMGEYESVYYDSPRNSLVRLRPVPPIEVIHATFARRLGKMRAERRKVV